jgi:hypothetical protein
MAGDVSNLCFGAVVEGSAGIIASLAAKGLRAAMLSSAAKQLAGELVPINDVDAHLPQPHPRQRRQASPAKGYVKIYWTFTARWLADEGRISKGGSGDRRVLHA